MAKKVTDTGVAPKHLRPATREWIEEICRDYELESQDLKLLRLAAESWDRVQEAREEIAKHGSLTFTDRFGQPHAMPQLKVELDSRKSFSALMRELSLDVAPPAEPKRPPPLRANVR